MSSSSMQMAVSEPSGPALAAWIILRTSSGLKHSDPSFNSWVSWRRKHLLQLAEPPLLA
jgi:hypothetical protein